MKKQISREIKDFDHEINKHVSNGVDPRKFLNLTQTRVLLYLNEHENDEVCQKDLEEETKLKKASMTGCLDCLEDKGIIIRKQSKEDKRRNIIFLTDKAKKKQNEIKNRIDNMEKTLRKDISEDELNQFLKTLEKMRNNLKEAHK